MVSQMVMENNPMERQDLNKEAVATSKQLILHEKSRAYSDPKLISLQDMMLRVYENLPTIANALALSYYTVAKKWQIDCRKVSIFISGGRALGKPLKEDSDIDIIIVVANLDASIESFRGGTLFDADNDARMIMVQEVKHGIPECSEGLVHVMRYGLIEQVDTLRAREGYLSLGEYIYEKE